MLFFMDKKDHRYYLLLGLLLRVDFTKPNINVSRHSVMWLHYVELFSSSNPRAISLGEKYEMKCEWRAPPPAL